MLEDAFLEAARVAALERLDLRRRGAGLARVVIFLEEKQIDL
jgi:hypothetical protein